MSNETVSVPQFIDYLNKHADVYNGCDVLCISHVKNLKSNVLHEYLHIIIRDAARARWRRLLAERQSEQDQVIIGFWPWTALAMLPRGSSSSSSASSRSTDLLPLIMQNITVHPSSQLWLKDVARVLVEVNREAPSYNVFSKNCFWYADSVFKLLKNRGEVYKWSWIDYMGWAIVPNPSAVRANSRLWGGGTER